MAAKPHSVIEPLGFSLTPVWISCDTDRFKPNIRLMDGWKKWMVKIAKM